MPRIKAITFDLDDTLWELKPVMRRAEQLLQQWLEQHAPNMAARFDVDALRELRLQLIEQTPAFQYQLTQLRITALEKAMEMVGYDRAFAREKARLGFEVFLQARHEVTFFEHALHSLEQLAERYTLGVLTNGNASVERLGIDRYFDFAFTAEQLKIGKPAAKVFLAAADVAGTDVEEMIHVGDHIDNDVRAAQQVGYKTIWVNRNGETWPYEQLPDQTVVDLQQLPDAVAAIDASS